VGIRYSSWRIAPVRLVKLEAGLPGGRAGASRALLLLKGRRAARRPLRRAKDQLSTPVTWAGLAPASSYPHSAVMLLMIATLGAALLLHVVSVPWRVGRCTVGRLDRSLDRLREGVRTFARRAQRQSGDEHPQPTTFERG
jgi:hypothetical protein